MGTPANEGVPHEQEGTENKVDELKEMKQNAEEGKLKETEAAEEEDVPDDFFDDFSNQDFMDGLDIVDAWDDSEKKAKTAKAREEKRKEKKRIAEKILSPTGREKRRRSDEQKRPTDKERKSRDEKEDKEKKNKLELRRDPLKTKRDLEKDRENYTKKKEQKLISKVVETGLVPPGMEMEVNIFDIQEKKSEKEISKSKEKKSRERSREIKRRRSRSRSFNRNSPIYRNRMRSNERWEKNRRRERTRERSRERIRTRSPVYRPRDLSPYSHRKRRSISDRERWLQSRRSVSPERKYKMGEEKLSFLEELKIKLDGIPSNPTLFPYSTPAAPNYTPSVVYPNQVPSNQYFPQNSPYDQSFFIGDAQPVPPVQQIAPLQIPPTPVAPVVPQMNIIPNHLSPVPVNNFMGVAKVENHSIGPVPPPNPVQIDLTGMNSVSKLMEQIRATTAPNKIEVPEKRLSLSDYLTINKKPTAYSTNSEAFKKKINVLSRCQDVLTELSGDKKLAGKLIVKKSGKNLTTNEIKNVSPLLRTDPVTFSYTLATKNEESTFQFILNRVLSKSGLQPDDDVVLIEEKKPLDVVSPQKFNKKKVVIEPIKVLMKMCQTDPVTCEECTERKKLKFKDAAVQCGETERYNVGVQVIEADINNFRIPRNQSLAYLTPAQLLGRGEPTSTKVDSFTNFEKPATQQAPIYYRDPRSYGMSYPGDVYQGGGAWDPRFPRF